MISNIFFHLHWFWNHADFNLYLAFDDQTSTFVIPAGAGFQVIFCPGARSTNILAVESQQLHQLAQSGQAPSGGEYIHLNMTTSAAIRTSGFGCFTFGIALAIAGCSFLISPVFWAGHVTCAYFWKTGLVRVGCFGIPWMTNCWKIGFLYNLLLEMFALS